MSCVVDQLMVNVACLTEFSSCCDVGSQLLWGWESAVVRLRASCCEALSQLLWGWEPAVVRLGGPAFVRLGASCCEAGSQLLLGWKPAVVLFCIIFTFYFCCILNSNINIKFNCKTFLNKKIVCYNYSLCVQCGNPRINRHRQSMVHTDTFWSTWVPVDAYGYEIAHTSTCMVHTGTWWHGTR